MSLFVNPSFAFDGRRRMEMFIDVIGTCNLRCPSCPVGNMGPVNPSGLMDVELFARIIEKAAREYHITHVGLYNWAENLLHPRFPELVRIVKRHDLICWLSSNLNVLRNPEELLRANPNDIRISLSGFTQPTYEQGHAKGDIERVKANMRILSDARRNVGNVSTGIHVNYHKYRYNLHEVEPMRQYAASLGFGWREDWAFYMPLEKALAAAEGRLDPEEHNYVERKFALPIVEAIAASRPFKHEPCSMWEKQIVLDVQGNAAPCCAVYDSKQNNLGSFLDMSPVDLMRAKENHPSCTKCMDHGLHRYFVYSDHPELRPIYEELVARNLATPSQDENKKGLEP